MDIQFTHDLNHPKSSINRHDFSSLNTPEWATRRRVVNSRGRRYTTPNPVEHGLKFTSQRVLEMPPYDQDDKILDKDTVWTQPLFPLVLDENDISQRRLGGGGSVSAMSGRSRGNVKLKTGGLSSSYATSDPVPCFSYDTLGESQDGFVGIGKGRRKWPRPEWHYKDLRPVFNPR